jgi:hypothetical protein
MNRKRLLAILVVLTFVFPQLAFSGSEKVSDRWLNCKVALIPVHFSDVPPTLTIDQINDAFKNLDKPDSVASFVNSLSYGKFKLDFGSFSPKKWLGLKKKRMDYWIEKSKYRWEVLTREFIDDTLALAKANGLNVDEYDNDKNGFPDYYFIFVSGSSQQDVHWYASNAANRGSYEIITEEHDIYKKDKSAWVKNLLLYYFVRTEIVTLSNYDEPQPVGMWDVTCHNADSSNIGVNSFNRWKLGLIEYKEISEPGTYEIDDLNGDGPNKGYRVKMPGTIDEWILLENRQRTGLDALLDGIPGTGIVMYHYDNDRSYSYNFNDPDDTNPERLRFGLEIFDASDDPMHKDAAWSADVGKTEMSWRNSPDNEPLFIKKYAGLHVNIKNISKSGPKMTFELAYENNSPEYITDTTEIDFGDVRKGLSKTLEAPFFYNFTGEIVCQFVTKDFWLSLGQASAMLGKTNLKVTVNTQNLDCGKHNGKVEYLASTAVGDIKIKVNVTHPVGDVNLDYKVDKTDADLFMKHYGTTNGDPDYNINADFDGNGKVDIEDFFLISKYWEVPN